MQYGTGNAATVTDLIAWYIPRETLIDAIMILICFLQGSYIVMIISIPVFVYNLKLYHSL